MSFYTRLSLSDVTRKPVSGGFQQGKTRRPDQLQKLARVLELWMFEGHLKSTWHGIITLQYVHTVLLKYIFLETGVHPLQNGLYLQEN